jgi:DNA-binding CsgD family transcriptional regulator
MAQPTTAKIARAVEILRTDLASRPAALRQYALELVTELAQGAGSLWYELGMVRGNPLPVRHRTVGCDVELGRHLEEDIPWPTTDPRLPPKSWNRSFVLLSSLVGDLDSELRPTRLYQRVWQPSKMEDQLRMVVYHRGEHVAWIGALRREDDPHFTRADQRRLLPIASALSDALVTARAVERAAEPEQGCDLLLTPSGKVTLASQPARAWVDRVRPHDWLRAWTRAAERNEPLPTCVDGRAVRWSRMYGSDGGIHYLLHLERLDPVRVHPSFVLSRMQREVARLAAAGASATEIASMYGITPATVRAHVKQIYELLEIASRAELGRILADVSPYIEGPCTIGELRSVAQRLPTLHA